MPVGGLVLFLALAVLVFGASREPGPVMVILVALSALLAATGAIVLVLGYAYQQLAYSLGESALRIQWQGRTTIVPYPAIQGIYTGQRLSGNAVPSRLRWPGISVGLMRVRSLGRLRFFATSTNQDDLTLVTVEGGGVILSAREPNEFRAALIYHVERYGEAAPADAEPVTWQQTPPASLPWTAFMDIWFPACVLLGTLALLLVLGGIDLRYDTLPDPVVLHFDANTEPSQLAPKSDLLRLPLLGFACLLVNWVVGVIVHPRERVMARLLWLGGVAVLVVLLVGLLRLLQQ